ncbi:hypothetical protein [Glycomyces sp. NRRL B-16210]|uniref:hypothetical protein n=1 Tax=Glycomyces sp. NRRL B-16210 TaxID=1463821 RepID=UPI0004C03918|nr:hypothetical protein [Glycomyces sp. NRRL B-16210]
MRKFEVALEGHGNICARSSYSPLMSPDEGSEESFEAALLAALEQSETVEAPAAELAEAASR